MTTPSYPTLIAVDTQEPYVDQPIQTALQNILTLLKGQSIALYNDVVAAINASPYLANKLNSAANSEALKQICYAPVGSKYQNAGGYQARSGIIWIGQNFLTQLTNPQINASLTDALVFVLGHEAYHALDAQALSAYRNGVMAPALESSLAAGSNVTSLLVSYAQTLMADEANANLEGWNALISTLQLQKGAPTSSQLISLYNATGYAQLIINGNGTPISGMTFGANGSASSSPILTGNTQAETVKYEGAVGGFANKSYSLIEPSRALALASQEANGAVINVNMNTLMTCLNGSYSSPNDPFAGLASLGYTAGLPGQPNKVYIHDLSTNATGDITFDPSTARLAIFTTLPGKKLFYFDYLPVANQSPVSTLPSTLSLSDEGSTLQFEDVSGDLQIDGQNLGGIFVGNNVLTGTGTVSGSYSWVDGSGDQYSFQPGAGFSQTGLGTLQITGSQVTADSLSEITIDNFSLSAAESAAGEMGINLSGTLTLSAGASAGTTGPVPNFVEGSEESYTLSANAPSTTAQTIVVTLSGATPSDFEAIVGNTVEQLNANGTFNVTLAAGETNVAFTLQDTTTDNGSSDIANGATLQLTASMPNLANPSGAPIGTSTLTFNYVSEGSVTAPAPLATDVITGTLSGGVTTFTGDGGNDYIDATGTGTPNYINATNSGNDSIIGGTGANTLVGGAGNNVITLNGTSDQVGLGTGHNTVYGSSGQDNIESATGTDVIIGNNGTDVITLGNGNNEIYAGSQVSLAAAIALARSSVATNVQGDLLSVQDGNNTIVSGNGNDVVLAGTGSNVVVLGPGQDTFFGGIDAIYATDWNVTGGVLNNVDFYEEGYTNTFQQPYYGWSYQNLANPNVTIASIANDTIYSGNGNDSIVLGNGNNYVDLGSGKDTVENGMGNDTILAGSGADYIAVGGGTEYIEGGSGSDTIFGGDGSNTIIGGSGNSTIYSSFGPGGTNFANANLDQNYVTGGSGNDVIYGSAGQDTLIAGTGNTTIYGQTGSENIVGGTGNDLLVGGSGNDTIDAGGAGRDTLNANGASTSTSVLYGGDGRDYIVGGSGSNTLYAGDGGTAGAATSVFASQSDSTAQTTIYGGLGVDLLEGGVGSTVIYAGDGGTAGAATTLIGFLSGNDTLYGGLGTDFLQGGAGTDVLYAGDGGTAAAPTTVISGTGVDTLNGGAGPSFMQDVQSGHDLLISGTANDTLIGVGADTLVAGSGNDLMQANGGSVNFEFNPGFGNDTLIANGGTVNVLFGSGILATDFTGAVTFDSSGNSYLNLSGDGGSILIEGGLTGALTGAAYVDPSAIPLATLLVDTFGGDQTIAGGSANFILNLGNSETVAPANSGDTVSSWGNNVTITGGSLEDDIYSTGTSALIGSGGFDKIDATGNDDTIDGGTYGGDAITVSGANSVVNIGSSLNDDATTTVTAAGTNDTVVAASGTVNSNITVDNSSTVIQVASGAGIVSVQSYVSYSAPTNVSNLTLVGSSGISATGNSVADILTAGAGTDTLFAGSSGHDTLVGGSGGTTFVVNSSGDVIEGASSSASNSVQSSVSFSLIANVNNLLLTGTGALIGSANSGNDTLISNSGIDTLYGGAGSDVFILNNPSDVVIDTGGTATIVYAGSTNFTLPTGINSLTLLGTAAIDATGNSSNDLLVANAGADTLVAGSGTDTLISGGGTAIDSLVAGTGNDLFVVNYAADQVTVGATHGNDTVESSVSYTAPANVTNLTLIGSSALIGTGNSLADVLVAGTGNDTLVAVAGFATLQGGVGNDAFVIASGSDVVVGATTTSNDTIYSSVSYTLPTNVNSLVLTGTFALTGTANGGADTLTSNTGVDTLYGGSGNDGFVINNSSDVIVDTSTTTANSVLSIVNYSLAANVNSLTLMGTVALRATGNSGNDLITGNSGADTLTAGSGSDTLVSGSGIDSLVGGTGTDLFIVNNSSDVVTMSGGSAADSIEASVNYTLPTAVNYLALTGTANLTGTAVSGSNVLVANSGNDVLIGGSGTDIFHSGTGIDTLIGGLGQDEFYVNNDDDVVETNSPNNLIWSSVSYSLSASENLLTLTGDSNLVGVGGSGADTVYANEGNDTLIAGSGATTMYIGMGADVLVINSTADVVESTVFLQTAAQDTIESSASYTLPSVVNVLLLTGSANLSGTGNAQADSLIGNAGADFLTAGTGNDTIIAGSGLATSLVAGAGSGNDVFVIDSTSDVVQDSASNHSNVLISSVSYSLPTNINTLLLTGSSNITGIGNSANDSIQGNAGNDSLIAGAGQDTLASGLGVDTLIGGAGSDTFIIANAADVIESASSAAQNAALSSVSFVLPISVNSLTLTGATNIAGTGNAANDTLTAGAGLDTLTAGTGLATLIGGSWNDTFVVNNTGDVVQDSVVGGNSTIQSSVNSTLVANVNTLMFTGTTALEGTANGANDTLVSNTALDTLVGGAGNDTFVINNSADVIQDTSGTASNVADSSVNYTLAANVNTLMFTGTSALVGTASGGADTLVSNSGVDTLLGGSGNDTFIISNAGDVVLDTSTTASNVLQSSVSYTLPTDVNALTLTGTIALSATGNTAVNFISANSGNDTLVAGSGVATLIGGGGNDTFVVDNTGDVVQDTAATASNTIESSVSMSLAANVNTLVLTGTGALTGTANSGSDTLVSNTGVDTLVGGSGQDLFIVNNSADVIQNWTSNDTLEASVNYTLPANINSIILIGAANIAATGNANSDVLTAGSGIDTLLAGGGVATMNGGSGNDTFVVNNSSDVVQDLSTATSNSVQSSVSYSLPSNVDTLTLTGTLGLVAYGNQDANNVITANAGDDVLIGTAFGNTINGGSGSDTIEVGPYNNFINAGSGGTASQPTYVYGNATGTNVATESTIYGGSGTDVLYGGPGSDLIYGGTGVDSLFAGIGFDSLYGTAGSNVVDTLGGYDLLVAGSGTESLSGIGADTLVAGNGADSLDNVAPSGSSLFEVNAGFGQVTIGSGTSNGENILFGTGIEPSSFTITAEQTGSTFNENQDLSLVLADGSSGITIPGGIFPGVIGAVNFADTGSESLAQLVNLDGPGTVLFSYFGSQEVFSTGNDQSMSEDNSVGAVFAFGNNDTVATSTNGAPIYAYGSGDSITGTQVWLGGNGDVLTFGANATVVGSNDTIDSSGSGNLYIEPGSSGTSIVQSPGAPSPTIYSDISFTLPANVQVLVLNSGFSDLSGSSNAQGGMLVANGNFDTLTGGPGTDLLEANESDDVLIGGSGAETYYLENSSDSIQFGTGNASLNAVEADFNYTLGASANALTILGNTEIGVGNSANDSLTATGSNDTLVAGSGSDTLVGSYLIGGSGNDTFVVGGGAVIVESSTTSSNTVNSSVSFTLPTDINALNLTNWGTVGVANGANDSLTAQSYSDTLLGGAGADTLVGDGSVLIAGSGNSVLVDGSQAQGINTFVFNSGFGNDQIENPQDGDVIQFGAGVSEASLTFTALPGTDGAAASFVISGAGGAVTVQGGLSPGAIGSINFTGGSNYTLQQLLAPSGLETIAGADGNLILTSANSDSLTAGSGQDTVIAWGNNDTINAGTDGTLIYAEGTGDYIVGGGASDSLVGFAGSNTLVGGSGNENFFVDTPGTVIMVSAGVGHDTVFSSVSYTVPNNVSVLTLIGSASISATANSGNDLITGNSGNDTFYDYSGGGADTFLAGTGSDQFVVTSPNDVIEVTSPNANDGILSYISLTLPANVNSLSLEGTLNLSATGNAGNDTISGNSGTDILTAGSGNDFLEASGLGTPTTLIGGSGADELFAFGNQDASLISGSGVDTLVAGQLNEIVLNNSYDVLQLEADGQIPIETISSSVDYTFAPAVADVVEGSTPAITWNLTGTNSLTASAGQNNGDFVIKGNAGADTITGGTGSNELIAGLGIDTLVGGGDGSSNDFYIDNSNDVIVTHEGETNSVFASINYTLPTSINTLYVNAANLAGTGNANGDYIVANSTNDTLIAGSGADELASFSSGNTLVAGSGDDSLYGWDGDTVDLNAGFDNSEVGPEGGSGDVTVQFGAGISAASLTASAVIDIRGSAALTISNGTGIATLDGALANQAYLFEFASDGTLTLAQFLQQVNVTTSSMAGASGNVILEGTASASVTGGNGNDTIYAAAANDTIVAGSGNQVLDALGADDLVTAGSAGDTLSGLGTNDTLVAGAATDTLIGGTGATVEFVVNGTGNAIQLQSSPGADTLASSINYTLPTNVNTLILAGTAALKGTANTGADTLVSNAALDTLVGSSGSDFFVVNNASDVIQDTSSSAVNTIQSAFSYSLPTDVNRLLLTGSAALTGQGNGGSDTLTSNSGIDTLTGGTGSDTFIVNNAADVVQDTTTTTANTIQSAYNYTLPTNVNNLLLTGSANLTGAANNGTDTLTSNTGIDTLMGGSGNDTFVINGSTDVIQDTSTTASNSIQSSVNYSLATNVNSLLLTGSAALTASANSGADTLTSNTGADTLLGGSGNDTFVINNSGDLIQDTSTTAINIAKSSVSYSLATNVNNLLLTGSGNIVGTANGGNDSLTANTGSDTLVAGMGVDTLVSGTSGADSLVGGSGNDTFFVNNTADVVTDTAIAASNVISSTVSFTLPTDVNSLIFTGTAALKATGNSGNDSLTANTGSDTLVGGSGIDTLVSGTSGTDSLVGGSGNDLFFVNNTADIVTDTSTATSNTLSSTVSYTLPTNVNTLIFTGTAALKGTANTGNDSLTANTGADTLVAGSGIDTLVSGTTGTDSLVGGSGNDVFFVNNTADKVTDTSTTASNTILSSVTYTLPTDVNTLILTGTAALAGTGNTTADSITGNSGTDTLTAGTGVGTLIGGAGNDTFVINSASDVIQDTSTTSSNLISSTASYTLPTNVNSLIFTGTSALKATANGGNDSLTANTGADTLVAGSGTDTLVAGTTGTDSLVGGSGNDTFLVNNTADIVTDTSTTASNLISSIVTYSLPTDVNSLIFTGTAALKATANSGNDSITANTGADTLVAGSGTDTLVSGTAGTDSLVGGSGNDTFFVNNTADKVTDTSTTASNTISSTVSYTLPTDVQYLALTGTSALAGTGNSVLDLISGNAGNDTLTAGTGIAALEGGNTAGSDQMKAASNQAALIAGAGSSTLTGGAFKDFYAAGTVSDSITTGATANVVSINKGDGATTLAPTTSATNVLSLGGGIDTESLFFTKTGNNLVLTDGVSGDSVTFTNWYVGSADQDYTNLQVVEIASANYNSGGSDPLRNTALEDFNFTALVTAYNAAGSPANWALSTDMASAQLSSSATADYGGDLAYYFGLNGNLTGVNLSDISSTLTNASFGTAAQTIDSFSSISGGSGLHLLALKPGSSGVASVAQPGTVNASGTAGNSSNGGVEGTGNPALPAGVTAPISVMPPDVPPTTVTSTGGNNLHLGVEGTGNPGLPTGVTAPISVMPPDVPPTTVPTETEPRLITPRFGIEDPSREERTGIVTRLPAEPALASSRAQSIETTRISVVPRRGIGPLEVDLPRTGTTANTVSAADIAAIVTGNARRILEPVSVSASAPRVSGYVDPINVAWLTMHASLDLLDELPIRGAETNQESVEVATGALLSSTPLSQIRRTIEDPDLGSPLARKRAM
jgi:Ca2+-binding RTX toxin-like protein